MATTRTVAILPTGATESGYDAYYNDMAAFETAEDGDLTDAGGTYLKCEIITSDGSWSGSPDTSTPTYEGWACDYASGEYIHIIAMDDGSRSSDGLWDTTAYIKGSTTSLSSFKINNDWDVGVSTIAVVVDYLQIQHTGSDHGVQVSSGQEIEHIELNQCYINQDSTANIKFGIILTDTGTYTAIIVNCIIDVVDTTGTGIHGIDINGAGNHYIYNCTIFGANQEGIESDNHTVYAKNNAVFNNADDFQDSFTSLDYNASDDADGTNAVNISPENGTESSKWHDAFTDPDGSPPDVTIKDTNSVLYLASEITQADDSYVPSIDITGNARNTGAGEQVCIGAFEYVVAGRATKNTDASPLGVNAGISFRMN